MRYNRAHIVLFLAPLLVIVLLMYGMMAWTIYLSLTDSVGLTPSWWKFSGLKNYGILINGPLQDRFLVNLTNNVTWLVVFIVPSAALGLLLAYGLELSGKAESLFRPLFLYPLALSFVVTGTMWAWMYDPDAGVINNILKGVGLGGLAQAWIADPRQVTFCLIVAAVWQYTGFAMTLYLAAIRDIPGEIFEAARVDGATNLGLFRYIVVPNVGHATMIAIGMLTIFTLKVFDLVYVMTMGGPGYASEVLAHFMYMATYRQQLLGIGAAVSVFILIVAAAVVVPYSWWSMKRLQS
jgi:ABC-type sugar transport system permease subunit